MAEAIVPETAYDVDPDVKVVVKGKKANLVDVKLGMHVTLQMSGTGERAAYIVAIVAKP